MEIWLFMDSTSNLQEETPVMCGPNASKNEKQREKWTLKQKMIEYLCTKLSVALAKTNFSQ